MTETSQDSAKPAHGQQVITCVAFIHKVIDGKPHVLVAKRAATKKFLPGLLELPGGHIDFGETLGAGLAREVKEELAIDIQIGAPFSAFTYINDIKGSHSVEIAYFATLADPAQEVKTNPDDHESVHWISEDAIKLLVDTNGADDAELPIVRTGLAILGGAHPDFAE